MRKAILLLAAMAALVVACLGTALAQATPSGTLDANTLPAPVPSVGGYGFSDDLIGQTFTALNDGDVTSVQLYVDKYGGPPGPGDLSVRLTTVDSGIPGATLASTTVPSSAVLQDAYSLVTADFADPAPIEAGTQYAIVLTAADGACCYSWHGSRPIGAYTGGMLMYNIDDHGWQPEGSYTGGVTDAVFAVYLNGSQTPAYDFGGFFSPVDNPEVATNKAKAGSAIPVKFSLGGDQGLDIFAEGYPKSQQIPNPQVTVDGVEQTVAAGSSGLSYDPATDRYTYVWKTEKGWAGQYRQLVVQFDDGTIKRANFSFTR